MPTSLFVAVGHDGLRMSSSDGTNWRHKTTGKEGETYRSVAFGNGLFVAVGSYGGHNIVASTATGETWKTGKIEANYVKYIRGLTFGNGTFLGLGGDPGSVGNAKPFVMLSKDGIAWDGPFDAPGRNILRRAAWGNGRFAAVGDRGRRAGSADGKAWTDAPAVKAIDTLVDVAFGNGVFVGVGLHGLRMASGDGVAWTEPQRGEEGEHLNSVVFAKDRFFAVGAGATYTSADGKAWTRTPNENPPQVTSHGAGLFVGAAWKGRVRTSTDAVHWREAAKFDQNVTALAWGELA